MKTLMRILVVLTLLATLSIPFISYANASITDGYSTVTCKVKGFAIHQTHLQVFVDILIDQDVHFAMPINQISDVITKEVTTYRLTHRLERFTDKNTAITIMKVSVH
jgi:hypothetical protein